MGRLWITDVDQGVTAVLKTRAKLNHRSLQGEIKAILRDTVQPDRTVRYRRSPSWLRGRQLKRVYMRSEFDSLLLRGDQSIARRFRIKRVQAT